MPDMTNKFERFFWRVKPLQAGRNPHFGMKKKSQKPPSKCPDCGAKMSESLFVGSMGPIIVECTAVCGCYFAWHDPWMRMHYLPLFRGGS